jgi:hypothetical protein
VAVPYPDATPLISSNAVHHLRGRDPARSETGLAEATSWGLFVLPGRTGLRGGCWTVGPGRYCAGARPGRAGWIGHDRTLVCRGFAGVLGRVCWAVLMCFPLRRVGRVRCGARWRRSLRSMAGGSCSGCRVGAGGLGWFTSASRAGGEGWFRLRSARRRAGRAGCGSGAGGRSAPMTSSSSPSHSRRSDHDSV